MKIAIIINKNRATDTLRETLQSNTLSEKYALNYDVFYLKPDEIESFLKKMNHQSYNAYLIGGGDGTVRTATQALIDANTPLAILPLGTFNLLANSLNYPNDIDALFSIIKNNKTKLIDLAEVNNIIFINHVWIGFYYYILKLREKHKAVLGKNKLLKIIFTTFTLFKHLPIYHLEVIRDEKCIHYRTCLIYLANNESLANVLDFGEHKTLTSGLINVTILNCHTRWDLFKCMLSLLTGQFKNSNYVTQFSTSSLTITNQSEVINAVIDGELMKLNTPLHFVNHQKKLSVLVP